MCFKSILNLLSVPVSSQLSPGSARRASLRSSTIQARQRDRMTEASKAEDAPALPSTSCPPFPLLDLPPELRERIYFFALNFPPIETAAIPGTPDYATIPALAHTSRLVRDEALGVFYRNRPVEISLHCRENVRRAEHWADAWMAHSRAFATVNFSGRLAAQQGDFFALALKQSQLSPYFNVHHRPSASASAERLTSSIVERVEGWVKDLARSAESGHEGKLTADQLKDVIRLIKRLAGPCDW